MIFTSILVTVELNYLQEFSPDGQFVVSADRDFKIRVNSLSPLNDITC